jgi:hypothetical protein
MVINIIDKTIIGFICNKKTDENKSVKNDIPITGCKIKIDFSMLFFSLIEKINCPTAQVIMLNASIMKMMYNISFYKLL